MHRMSARQACGRPFENGSGGPVCALCAACRHDLRGCLALPRPLTVPGGRGALRRPETSNIMDLTDPDASPAVLSVTGIGKTYVETVLCDIALTLRAGEALALTGENGAGKSTLSKIIGGLVTPTAGTMQLAGAPYAPASRTSAEALGVRMVMQELNLLPTLSVAENLFLNRLPRAKFGFGWIDRGTLRRDAREAMAQVGLDAIDPDTLVGELGIGHQQMVEIARNLIGDCRVLILDEPTAMLTAREVDL